MLDELTGFSGQQLLGLPLTAPLTALGGAVRGVSFGLFDPTQEIAEGLGDFAPSPLTKSALEVAGEIGGSFVPYIGAARTAQAAFKGLDLTSKLLRGATTFGAPEILRQALHGEFNPQGAVRSLATGAAFSLPVGRAVLAPAVFATELATGGSLVEAGTAAGFAALFGPLEGKVLRPKPAGDAPPVRPFEPAVDTDFVALRKIAAKKQAPTAEVPQFTEGPRPRFSEEVVRFPQVDLFRPRKQSEIIRAAAKAAESSALSHNVDVNALPEQIAFKAQIIKRFPILYHGANPEGTAAIEQAGALGSDLYDTFLTHSQASAQVHASKTGGRVFTVRTKDIPAELLEDFDKTAIAIPARYAKVPLASVPDPKSEALNTLASTVELLAQNTPGELAGGLAKAVEVHGPSSQQAKTVQLALAEARNSYVPAGAPPVNSLGTTTKGIDVIAADPTSPFVQRAARERVIATLQEAGDPIAATQAAQLERLYREAGSRRKGGAVTLQDANDYLRRQDDILKATRIRFRDDDDAFATYAQEVARYTRPSEITAFVETLPPHYAERGSAFVERVRRFAAGQRSIAARIEAERLPIPEDFLEAGLVAGNHGAALHPVEGRVGMTVGGQDVGRRFRNFNDATKFVNELEDGVVQPANIQQLRMLAHPRAIVVDFDGSGVQVTNQVTGETVTGISSLEEAVALVRKAPRLDVDAPDLVPPTLARLPAPGHIGGVAAEQGPPSCSALTDFISVPQKEG